MAYEAVAGRDVLPIPDIPPAGLTTYDAKDPDTDVSADRAVAAAGGRAERPDRPDRRRRLRRVERVRWAVPDTELRAARRQRAEVQPLPHDGVVLADPLGAADRAQPPLGRDGQHRRAGHVGAGEQLDLAEHGRAAGQDPAAQRLQHRPVRQVPRGAGVGDEPDGPVPPVADRAWASSTSTGSSAGRPTSTTRRCTRASRRSSRTRPPRRATTSTTTSRRRRSSGSASRRR